MEYIGFFIAAGLGLWAWSDAKKLQERSIRVSPFSAAAWGWLVALVAIVFGIMYLIQRPKAIADADARMLRQWQDAPRDIVDLPLPKPAPINSGVMPPPPPPGAPATAVQYCTECGTKMRADASYCPGCGRNVTDDA